MSDTEWLQNLRAGDTVVVTDGEHEIARQVFRITPTQVVLAGGSRFRKTTGALVGGSTWDTRWIEEATPERLARIAPERLRRRQVERLRGADWSALPAELVKQVHAIVFPEEPGK